MKKTALTIIVSVLISAILFGCGGYFLCSYLSTKNAKLKSTHQAQNVQNESITTASKEDFLDALKTGLEKRSSKDKSTNGMDHNAVMQHYNVMIKAEISEIEKYYNTDFGDKVFNKLVNQYIEAVRVQLFSTINSKDICFHTNTFAAGLITRSSIILEFCKNYGLELTDEQINYFISYVPSKESYKSLTNSNNKDTITEAAFDEEAVIKELDISSRSYTTSGYSKAVYLIKNNSPYNLEFNLQVFAYDDKGNIIGIDEGSEYVIGSGNTIPVEITFDSQPHSFDYKISVAPSSHTSIYKDFEVESSFSGKNAIINITNSSTQTAKFTKAYVIFKKGDTVIYCGSAYIGDVNSVILPQKTEFKQIECRYDFDNIEVYYEGQIE